MSKLTAVVVGGTGAVGRTVDAQPWLQQEAQPEPWPRAPPLLCPTAPAGQPGQQHRVQPGSPGGAAATAALCTAAPRPPGGGKRVARPAPEHPFQTNARHKSEFVTAGREVVGQLLSSPHWDQVTTVGRREVEVPKEYQGWVPSKLKQVIVNMDKLEEEGREAFQGADSVFCALGTTRAAAGSAEAFRKVDLHYVEATARAAKAGGVPHFSLVSAAGANARIWASDLKPFHALLYSKIKGQAEEAVKSQGFKYVTILRPGLLERGDKARGLEKAVAKFMDSVPAAQVARAMVGDAQAFHAGAAGAGGAAVAGAGGQVRLYAMKEIQQYGQGSQ